MVLTYWITTSCGSGGPTCLQALTVYDHLLCLIREEKHSDRRPCQATLTDRPTGKEGTGLTSWVGLALLLLGQAIPCLLTQYFP